jgi:dienelactone hydrolase/lysophospholipase L1-like esterase
MSEQPEIPTVVLVGDSIRMGYAPHVTKRLAGAARVVSAAENGEDSRNVLAHLAEWVVEQQPLVVHLNCGLHDLKRTPGTGKRQVEPTQYVANLRAIVARVREETKATLIFATTTPVHDERHARRGAGFDRLEADVREYNTLARTVMTELGVPIHDLHRRVHDAGAEQWLGSDGVHYTPEAEQHLAEAVTDCVRRQISIRRAPVMPAAPSGPAAAAEYRRKEAERDAQVPAVYRNLSVPQFAPPASKAKWARRRPEVRRLVEGTLGEIPPRPAKPKVRLVSREIHPGYTLERLGIDNEVDGEISLLLLVPEGLTHAAPAVMWLHSSTPDKNQVLTPNTFWGEKPLGETLVRAGYVVCAPDTYWHGDRASTGPAGKAESRHEEHEGLHKANLWLGRTLWGMFVRDDRMVLDYLCSRPEVDAARIGAVGMSLGSTRAWWLAALDDRLATAIGIACLTRYQNLLAHGQLREHGVYYFVHGLLRHFDTEAVLSLIAPRPFLALSGDLDAGTPADGVRELERQVSAVYRALDAPERFRSVLYPEVGHTVTAEMRTELHAWFARWLRPGGSK